MVLVLRQTITTTTILKRIEKIKNLNFGFRKLGRMMETSTSKQIC